MAGQKASHLEMSWQIESLLFLNGQFKKGRLAMKHLLRLFLGLLVPAFILVGMAANPSFAQDKAKDAKAAPAAKEEKGKNTVRVLIDNNKVQVIERTYRPGDVNTGTEQMSSYRVNHTVKGGTLERTYADGRKEKIEVKAGMVRFLEPAKGPSEKYTTKNIGNTEIVSVIVILK
jgi:hypothetical protein